MSTDKLRVLVELRPALDGHAGIPQETRLLFRGLRSLDVLETEGLLQSSGQLLARGLPANRHALAPDKALNRLSRVVVSLHRTTTPSIGERVRGAMSLSLSPARILLPAPFGISHSLSRFEATHFKDFIWRSLFARTLHHDDFELTTNASFRIARLPWTVLHKVALATHRIGHAYYPRFDTRDFDFFIAETPFPGRVHRQTRLIVRYHDAIPLLMPHTIADKGFHQASHYLALRSNVRNGAYFACVSDSTRRDLLNAFPQAEHRAVTIHNMVSHHYFHEESSPARIPEILRTRANVNAKVRVDGMGAALSALDKSRTPEYLLMVSTIEPRKNHLSLLAAWEQLRADTSPQLKLVIVGMLGWEHANILKRLRPWVERGQLFLLEDVPSAELRVLYRHALATICPSLGEGFDYSGVEAMRCGSPVVASDIAVHREIFSDAAEYFNPYSIPALVKAITGVVGAERIPRREELLQRGREVSAKYLPEAILPKWHDFLARCSESKHAA